MFYYVVIYHEMSFPNRWYDASKDGAAHTIRCLFVFSASVFFTQLRMSIIRCVPLCMSGANCGAGDRAGAPSSCRCTACFSK